MPVAYMVLTAHACLHAEESEDKEESLKLVCCYVGQATALSLLARSRLFIRDAFWYQASNAFCQCYTYVRRTSELAIGDVPAFRSLVR